MRWAGRLVGAAAFVADELGRVLLVRHTYGALNWELPGGASEEGETFAQTALRELREETGLAGVAEAATGLYYDAERDAHHFVFRCRVDAGHPRPASTEISDCRYWEPERLPRPISDFTLRRIADAFAGSSVVLPVAVPPRTWLE